MRWRAFSEELVTPLPSLGVELVILLGALLADAPHTRPVPVIGAAPTRNWPPSLPAASPVDYKGPTGILGVLQHPASSAGIPAVSLWARVPHYVAQPPSPKATLALLHSVEDILDTPLPLADLPDEARAWERGVDELAEQDSEVADYVPRPWKRPRTPPTSPRPAATPSPGSSSAYFRRRGGAGESTPRSAARAPRASRRADTGGPGA